MTQQSNKLSLKAPVWTFRTFLLFIMLLPFAMSVNAQKDIADIRKQYQAAKLNIEQQAEEVNMRHCIQVEFSQNVSAIGPQKFTYKIYLTPHYSNGEGALTHTTLFASVSYNIAVRKISEEYLYDKDENLIFFYRKTSDLDGSDYSEYEHSEELRQYFKNGKLIKAQRKEKHKESPADSNEFKIIYDGEIPSDYLDDKRMPDLHKDGIIEIAKKVSGTSNNFVTD